MQSVIFLDMLFPVSNDFSFFSAYNLSKQPAEG